MNLSEIAKNLDVDVAAAVNRFGGMEILYIKYLKKFLQDDTFQNLEKSVEQKDMKLTEMYAHTLKGVAANLGLEKIRISADCVVQAVRQNEYAKVDFLFSDCKEEYTRAITMLQELD